MDSGFSELTILDDVNVSDQLIRNDPVRVLLTSKSLVYPFLSLISK